MNYYDEYPQFVQYGDGNPHQQMIYIGQKRQGQQMNPYQMYQQYQNFANGGSMGSSGGFNPNTMAVDMPMASTADFGSYGLGNEAALNVPWETGYGSGAGASSAGGSSAWGGMGAAGPYAAIIAAIIGQHVATNSNSNVYEGQPTGDVFSGDFLTEPWYAYMGDQLGWEPTAGEKFDAATSRSDWDSALKRLPAAGNYWANPAGNWIGYESLHNYAGDWAGVADPIGFATSKIEDWF
jgi:hypothetical protein